MIGPKTDISKASSLPTEPSGLNRLSWWHQHRHVDFPHPCHVTVYDLPCIQSRCTWEWLKIHAEHVHRISQYSTSTRQPCWTHFLMTANRQIFTYWCYRTEFSCRPHIHQDIDHRLSHMSCWHGNPHTSRDTDSQSFCPGTLKTQPTCNVSFPNRVFVKSVNINMYVVSTSEKGHFSCQVYST